MHPSLQLNLLNRNSATMLEMENRTHIYEMDMGTRMETVKNKAEENVKLTPKELNNKIWGLSIFVKSEQ